MFRNRRLGGFRTFFDMSEGNLSTLYMTDREGGGMYDRPNETGSPERNLLMAVLERAILDLVGNDLKESEEAERWIFGDIEDPSFDEFTFPWVCQELDLDCRRTAEMIRAIPKRGSSRIAPWYLTKHYSQQAG